ncbi:glutamate racemase [Clostridium sp. LIBA-8841]|uniref:glutamate racemase n=1 Tax=Clostridium sp. LIBA-8841 TaxID=2987530 RepID=UPI002AC39D9B|nr:glutamate racemase [Clostridium sp. LIBA-8841]MDZ5254757.1 glutamate racemase [Clostridium sp. LIBA-8841]
MQDDLKNAPIGFFDSGLGGLSVLRKALEMMPNENYIYYGDSKHAPYGEKTPQEITELSFNAIEFLIQKGVKAIVIACNTATSAAAKDLREYYKDIPIIGIEPALKPAIKLHETGAVIVMATKATLTQEKFKTLMDNYGEHRDIIPLPCPGLVEFIESGNLNGEDVKNFLREKLNPYMDREISSIVLGCTHYPFIKDVIQEIVGEKVDIIDGSEGTVKELNRRLEENNIKSELKEKGTLEIINSLDDKEILELSEKLIEIK